MNPTLVVLAAGMSTRYGGLKQLEPVGQTGEALLDFAAFDALKAGFPRIVLVIREELEEAFRNHITGRWPSELEVVYHFQKLEDLPSLPGSGDESEALPGILAGRTKPWGTAHALLTARPHLPEPFVVVNADDFYGSSALAQAVALLGREKMSEPGETPVFGLVAYTLGDTLSQHGGVTRGVCRLNPLGWLGEVEEVRDIRRTNGDAMGETLDGEKMLFSGGEVVSTNFWIFTPALFPLLEEGFAKFLASDGIEEGDMEFMLPSEVNRLLQEESAQVWVVRSHDPFFGITHPEDFESAAAGIQKLIEEGQYPPSLWG